MGPSFLHIGQMIANARNVAGDCPLLGADIRLVLLCASSAICHSAPMQKDFDNWKRLKARLNERDRFPTFRQREIWWFSVGVNVGHEEDGKGSFASRPVLIVRKFNRRLFWGVPLTTQIKEKLHYHRVHFKGKEQCVMLSQMRLWDAKRLRNKMGQLPEDQFEEIRSALIALLQN